MWKKALALASAILMLAALPASADPQSTPNGPWVQPEQQLRLNGLHDYEQLAATLGRIENASQGRVDVEVIGQSVEGRDLFLATVGSGPREVLFITQQHGDEVHGTEAALNLLRVLSGNNPEAASIREEITLRIIPRVNPDGAERPQRANADGLDLNRQHNPDVPAEDKAAPEATAVRQVHDRYQPDLFVDYHNQHSYVTEGRFVVTVDEPSAAAGTYDAAGASFGPEPPRRGVGGDIVLVDDGSDGPTLACEPLVDFPEGAVALVDRGGCTFVTKVGHAQAAGATAVIVANNVPGDPFAMGGSDPSITIPSVMVSLADGGAIKAGLPAQGTVGLDPDNTGGDLVMMSLFVSNHPDIADDVDVKSRQMGVTVFDAVDRYGHATVTEFPGASTRTIADTAYALLGSGSLLVESRGQAAHIGQKSAGKIVRQNLIAMYTIAAAAADGSLDQVDPNRFDELPPRGSFISNPR